jgi:hypothetical protein
MNAEAVETMTPERPAVRNWLNDHPATASYIALVVTVLLLLQIAETLGLF